MQPQPRLECPKSRDLKLQARKSRVITKPDYSYDRENLKPLGLQLFLEKIRPTPLPLRDVADSFWWTDGPVSHLVVSREGLWIHLVTSLPESELRRFADTLARP